MSKEVSETGETARRDYVDPPPAPLLDMAEIKLWSFYRALIAEFVATLLFLYITVATVIGYQKETDPCGGVGVLGIAWAFGGMIFVLVYCTAGISGGHINPAVTFGLFLARKVSLLRALGYMVAQSLGAVCGVGLVKAFMKSDFNSLGGGANKVAPGYNKGTALGAEIIGTFVLVYTVFSATDPKRSARDSHVPVCFTCITSLVPARCSGDGLKRTRCHNGLHILPTTLVIFLVTKFSPLRDDSWLKRMPLQAKIPYASLYHITNA